MRRIARSIVSGSLAALLLQPPPAQPVVPLVAMLGKEMLKNIIMGEVKGQLFGALSGMGCKGAALAGVLASASSMRTPGGGMPRMPAGMPMPGGAQMPEGVNMPGGVNMPRMMSGGMPSADMMAQMMAMAQAQMGPNAAHMANSLSPEQMANMQAMFGQMQQATAHPLTREETIAVFGELADLGIMTPAMYSEARDCIMLAPPGAGDAVGMIGAMMKTMVLPPLRDAKAKLANLTPEEQDELANAMVEQLRSASPQDRKVFLEGFGQGFFPQPVVDKVKQQL
jgi:hypothetical protein